MMNICSAKIQCSISEPMEKGRKKGKQTERARCKRTKNMSAKSILRKNFNDQEPPDLLVFGYQSKLYRDDVKALEFDRESHLIPAPYSSRELISRYDVRATLADIGPLENHEHYGNRIDCLPPAEQQAELLAEEERYYSLYRNEVEEEMYKEEQMKRQTTGYNQIAFSYDEFGPKQAENVLPAEEENDPEDQPFTPSTNLELPSDIEVPGTVKLNQIIEKTAKFISSHGPQMEILLKTKQAANPQFTFLNHDGSLNPYYKHILEMMKANTYPWQEAIDRSEENSQDSSESNMNGSIEPEVPQSIVIPTIKFKPSADCAYTQLISKITKAPISEIEEKQKESDAKQNESNLGAPVKVISSGLMGLIDYNSDSESEHDEEEEQPNKYNGPMPPTELQVVIDKTAIYVAKNGTDFEETLRKKHDPRFAFLDKSNEFHLYYSFKVDESRQLFPSPPVLISQQQTATKHEVKMPKTPPAPVCFSIKPKEVKSPLKTSVKLQAYSDDEHTKTEKFPDVPSPSRLNLDSVEEELERQVDEMKHDREEKIAKEKLKDKILNAAREKLKKDERKKRAMIFINQIKSTSNGNGTASTSASNGHDEIINLTQYGDDSDESVKSVPMTSTPPVDSRAISGSRRQSRKRSFSTESSSTGSYTSSSSRRSSRRSRSRSRKRSRKSKYRSKKKYRKRSRSRSASRYSRKKKDRHERDRRY